MAASAPSLAPQQQALGTIGTRGGMAAQRQHRWGPQRLNIAPVPPAIHPFHPTPPGANLLGPILTPSGLLFFSLTLQRFLGYHMGLWTDVLTFCLAFPLSGGTLLGLHGDLPPFPGALPGASRR